MGKFNLHRGSLQLRVLTLTLLFTLGVSIVITVSNMRTSSTLSGSVPPC